MPRSPDIELEGNKCGSCGVAIRGDLTEIKCDPCYYLQKGIKRSPKTIKPGILVDLGVDRTEMNEMEKKEAQTDMDNAQWIKYEPKETEFIPTWGPDVAGDPGKIVEEDGRKYWPGPILEGALVKDEIIKVNSERGPEDRRILTIKTVKGIDVAFWPNAMANRILNDMSVGAGDLLRIVYLGMKKSKTPGRKYKTYEIFRKEVKAKPGVKEDKGTNWLEGQKKEAAAEQGGQ
jgi:hypothetical protein